MVAVTSISAGPPSSSGPRAYGVVLALTDTVGAVLSNTTCWSAADDLKGDGARLTGRNHGVVDQHGEGEGAAACAGARHVGVVGQPQRDRGCLNSRAGAVADLRAHRRRLAAGEEARPAVALQRD